MIWWDYNTFLGHPVVCACVFCGYYSDSGCGLSPCRSVCTAGQTSTVDSGFTAERRPSTRPTILRNTAGAASYYDHVRSLSTVVPGIRRKYFPKLAVGQTKRMRRGSSGQLAVAEVWRGWAPVCIKNRISLLMGLDFYAELKYQSSTITPSVGIKYSMRDLFCDIGYCV